MPPLYVKQFRYDTDNFGYLIFGETEAMVIDGGAYKEIMNFVKSHNLTLKFLSNTHSHFDHTTGNSFFPNEKGLHILDYNKLVKLEAVELDGIRIDVYQTPGHTDDSVCFHAGSFLISGDTLFNGTIGNCYSGDLKSFYISIKKIMSLPSDTIIYAGHDYLKDSMNFALGIEPGNDRIINMMKKYDYNHVFSTLIDELEVNPYMRFNDNKMIEILKDRGLPCESEWDRWESIMALE